MNIEHLIIFFDRMAPFIVSIGVVFGAMTVFWRKYVLPIHQLLRAQLNDNGGGSLVDKIDALIETQDTLITGQKKNEIGLKAVELVVCELRRDNELVKQDLQARLLGGTE